MNRKLLLILPLILLSSCSNTTSKEQSFKLIEENRIFSIVNFKDSFSSINISIIERDTIHKFYTLFSEVVNENNLNVELSNSTDNIDWGYNYFHGHFVNVYLKIEFKYFYSSDNYVIYIEQNNVIYCFNGSIENYNLIINIEGD